MGIRAALRRIRTESEPALQPAPCRRAFSWLRNDFLGERREANAQRRKTDDEEDYDLEYSEDSNSEPDVDLENQCYNSKALKDTDPKQALESFQKVLELGKGEKGDWGFKALKQMIKIIMCNDEEDYDLEYSEDSNSEPDVDLENQYYNSKALKDTDPKQALESFQKVLELEKGEKGDWGFKALKQMIKINFRQANYTEMMARYKQLLSYIKSAVTRNYSEKSINSILDYISTSNRMDLLQEFYETTLDALKDAKNDRLWFKTNTKLGKLYFDRGDFKRLSTILKQLHQSCRNDDGSDDLKKGTQLLEIYALEIQMYTVRKNNKELKKLYNQSLHIKSAIPHPIIMGVIRECGGKMHLREGEYDKAHTDFFEAFKNYDESGSPRRSTCLKYLVLASMLMKSDINPFDSQEAKPYKNDPEILAMTNLVTAYQNNDIVGFEKILNDNRNSIMDDMFIKEHIEDLLKNIRTQVLTKFVKPYTQVRLDLISKELNLDMEEVEALLVSCILDNTIEGRIDQINQVLELTKHSQSNAKYSAMNKLTNQLASLQTTVMSGIP